MENGMLALIQTLVLALDIYWWILIASAIFSWLYAFNVVNSRNQFVGTIGNFLFRATEPVLAPIRRVLPDLGGIDISPIIVLLIIFFLRQFILTTIAPILLS
jgi:YggT family protein